MPAQGDESVGRSNGCANQAGHATSNGDDPTCSTIPETGQGGAAASTEAAGSNAVSTAEASASADAPSAPTASSSAAGSRRRERSGSPAGRSQTLRRRLMDVLRSGALQVSIAVDDIDGDGGENAESERRRRSRSRQRTHEDTGGGDGDADSSPDSEDHRAAFGSSGEEEDQENDGDAGGDATGQSYVVVDATGEDGDSDTGDSDGASEMDWSAFREQLASADLSARTLWRSSALRSPALTAESALAVIRWVERGLRKPAALDDLMLMCVVRCLERGHAVFEEEEDFVQVFNGAVELTETPECVESMLEMGALRAFIRGLQAAGHLVLEAAEEDKDWFELDRLVRIYKAFKTLWRACCNWPENDARRQRVTELIFVALGKWLRSMPLQDVWIGEDDILVFWVLIPLWPDYLEMLNAAPAESKAAEERSRFKEVCNWVLWPNDPVVESSYRLIGHLDLEDGEDFSLRFLVSQERFKWIVTPATKQRYLQYKVSQRAGPLAEEEQGLVLVVNRESPLRDLCHQLGVTGFGNERANLLSGITVHFGGGDSGGADEEGVDEGGPWREAIPLMFSELTSPYHGLFEIREEAGVITVEPRWCAKELVPDYQAQFELCGILIGMALVYQAYAPVHFSRCLLKQLFGLPCVVDDVPELKRQFAAIDAAGADLEHLYLTFSVDDATTGRSVELMENGAQVSVTLENLDQYKRLRTAWELDGRFADVLPHVLIGFHRIVPRDIVEAVARMVNPEELDIMLTGHGIDVKDWREHTEYQGFRDNSDIVKWFWEAVENFTPQEREDLWTFISGSKGVPPGGFGHLTNAAGESIRFTITKVEASPNHLPVAHTCGYQLDLAVYPSANDLTAKLKQAMSHRQGFGLA